MCQIHNLFFAKQNFHVFLQLINFFLLFFFFQLICQILNRVYSSTSTFQHVLSSSLPYVECVHKFLVVVPTIGIILTLLENELDDPGNSDKFH